MPARKSEEHLIKPTRVSYLRRPLHRAYALVSVMLGVALWAIVVAGIVQAAPSAQKYTIGWYLSNGQFGVAVQQPANDSPVQTPKQADPISFERQLLALINQARAAKGLPLLRANESLARSARTYSQNMSRSHKFALIDEKGKTPPQRAEEAGYKQAQILLELIGAGLGNPDQIIAVLSADPNASKVLFSTQVNEVSVGYAYAREDRTYPQYWTIDLGRRSGSTSLGTVTSPATLASTPTNTDTPTPSLSPSPTIALTPTETPNNTPAQKICNGTIFGVVRANGVGIANATVTLKDSDLNTLETGLTSANGQYAFLPRPPANYFVFLTVPTSHTPVGATIQNGTIVQNVSVCTNIQADFDLVQQIPTPSVTVSITPVTQTITPTPSAPVCTANISGFVRTLDGVPVAGVTVTLDNAFTSITDSNGRFNFLGVSMGNHPLTIATPPGYVPLPPLSITVKGCDPQTFAFPLIPFTPTRTNTTAPSLTPIRTSTPTLKPATPITLRSVSTADNSTGNTLLTIYAPAGLVGGDVMIAHIVVRDVNTAITPPTGWSLVRRDNTFTSIGAALYSKVVAGSESNNFTWTFSSSQQASGGIATFSGVNNLLPIDVANGKYNDSTDIITALAVTTTAPNDQLLFFVAVTTGTSVTFPSGMEPRWTTSTSSTTSAMADQPLSSEGGTGNRVGTSGAPGNSNLGQLLALRPASAATPIATATKPATLISTPAVSSRIYWGAYLLGNIVESPLAPPQNTPTIDEFESRVGKRMSILHWGQRWFKFGSYLNFDPALMETVRKRGTLTMLNWTSQDYGASPSYVQPTFSLRKITDGTHDAFIRQWAADAKNWGHPFFLRFDPEMNGDWEAWSELRNGNSAGQYVLAWKHVRDIFTQVGASNATWVWCPNVDYNGSIPLERLYPGDNYVDWTCIDGYNRGEHPVSGDSWHSFQSVFKPTYDHILRIAPTKPMMIGETSSTEYGGSKANWIADTLAAQLPKNFPNIKALVWFNVKNSDVDWAIETSPSALSAFAAGIASSYFAANDFSNLTTSPIPPLR